MLVSLLGGRGGGTPVRPTLVVQSFMRFTENKAHEPRATSKQARWWFVRWSGYRMQMFTRITHDVKGNFYIHVYYRLPSINIRKDLWEVEVYQHAHREYRMDLE